MRHWLVWAILLACAPAWAQSRTIESFAGATDTDKLRNGLNWVLAGDTRQLEASKSRYVLEAPVRVSAPSGPAVIDFHYADVVLLKDACLDISGAGETIKERARGLHLRNAQFQAEKGNARVVLRLDKTARLTVEDVLVTKSSHGGIELSQAWDATLRDVVVMQCGSDQQAAFDIDSVGSTNTNRVTLDNVTIERANGVSLRARRTSNLVMTGGSKIHGKPKWGYVGPLVELTDCPGAQFVATTLSWGDGGSQALFVIKGDQISSTLIDVFPEYNVRGKTVLNQNTNPGTRLVVRTPDN
ncbi:MAG: hypothetical protein KC910_05990 [Candidatus Eremiobacteraeota bacterium]|nr:hypothetical protein [Candidatus Eremiobacteraeota bacterium]